jgi:hypothetical protein
MRRTASIDVRLRNLDLVSRYPWTGTDDVPTPPVRASPQSPALRRTHSRTSERTYPIDRFQAISAEVFNGSKASIGLGPPPVGLSTARACYSSTFTSVSRTTGSGVSLRVLWGLYGEPSIPETKRTTPGYIRKESKAQLPIWTCAPMLLADAASLSYLFLNSPSCMPGSSHRAGDRR